MALNGIGISVVICTYNGKTRISPTLTSILNQDRGQSLAFELIIVDNASQDGTGNFCEKYLSEWKPFFPWKIVLEPKPGLNYARAKGFHEARFEIVVFCDDDNQLDLNYLKTGLEIFRDNPRIGALGGCGVPRFESAKPTWFDRFSHSYAVGAQANKDGKLKPPASLYGAGTFFRKAPLLNYFSKGFVTIMVDRNGTTLSSGGDVEMCFLIQLAGYEIWYDQRLRFTHSMPETRLQWSYYLRLKSGIASGSGSLFPYGCVLRDRNMGELAYILRWFLRTTFLTLLFLKHRARTLISISTLSPEEELSLVILRAKMRSFWLNGSRAFKHFKVLKSLV